MNYRKRKKALTKLLRIADDILEVHPLSSSAMAQYKYISRKLLNLKRSKHESMGSSPNAKADGSN